MKYTDKERLDFLTKSPRDAQLWHGTEWLARTGPQKRGHFWRVYPNPRKAIDAAIRADQAAKKKRRGK